MSSMPLFDTAIYQTRRQRLRTLLRERFGATGLVLLPGHGEAPMNYGDNTYPFRQDSSFLYFFGLQQPGRCGLLDLDADEDALYGDDPDLFSVVWTGPLPQMAELGARVGVHATGTLAALAARLQGARAQGRSLHYLAPYRGETVLWLAEQLGCSPTQARAAWSVALTDAVLALREIKAPEEIAEMESALAVCADMHHAAMRATRPGVAEREVVGVMEGLMRTHDWQLAYPVIFSRHGEVLHNHAHHHDLQDGDLVVNDTGCSSALGYASDITRTLPVGGRFSPLQRELYGAVLAAQQSAIAQLRAGVDFVDLHRHAAAMLVDALRAHGVFRGATEDVVQRGAYAIVFQCGLGHQIGLDVHDMEGLGEDRVGYGDTHQRSALFGMRSLRLAKTLRAGMVVTVEPGLYFIPHQQQLWRAQGLFSDCIDYDALAALSAQVRGIRIEDDVLVTDTGARVLGPHIARSVEEVEAVMGR
ncbi:MAG: aminopeptidase P family protein [Rhodoferax sp.]